MTKINKLVLHGFKSFAKRTELPFHDGFNIVLGPNGSGKSNILDSLCFVLGKSSAKALRSEKSANLIYNGGKSKKPSKNAEVSIYFDNTNKVFPTQDKEVKVSRIVKKNGTSVYKINDEARTRQQILELLSLARINPDGYNVILQGDIVRFVEMPTEERRRLIEEIAGIGVYEEKKQKAVKELEKVEEKLKESDIVMKERQTHLYELKRERDQAAKHQDLHTRVKQSKASLLHKQVSRKQKETGEFEKRMDKDKKSLQEKETELKEGKGNIKSFKDEITTINTEIEAKGEKEQVRIHKEVEQLKVSVASDKNRVESVKNEITKIKTRKQQLEQNNKEILTKMKALEKEQSELSTVVERKQKEQNMLTDKVSTFKKKHNLNDAADIEKEVDELDKNAEEKQKSIQELRQKQQETLREKDKIEFQIQAIDEKIAKVLEVEKENKGKLQELKAKRDEFKKSTLELNKLLNSDADLASQLGQARQTLQHANEQVSRLQARNISIQEKLGADKAVSALLEKKKEFGGMYGTVSELGDVSANYSLALEIVAGNKLKSLVVEDDKVAARCIKFLKENRLGVATFLPLNKVKAVQLNPEALALKKTNGVQGMAIDLIGFDPKFKKVFSYVFGNTLVVQNIDVARRIGVGKAKMVTLEGDLAEVSGAMHGGYRQKRPGLGFHEKEVTQELKQWDEKLANSQNVISRIEKERGEHEERIGKLREFKANLEGEIITLEKTLNLQGGDTDASRKAKEELRAQLKKVDEQVDEVQKQVSECNSSLAQNKIKRQQLRQKITELRNPALIAELNAFEEKRNELRDQIIKLRGDISNSKAQQENILGPEVANITKILKQHEKEEEDFSQEIKALNDKMTSMGVELKEKERQQQKFHEQFKELFARRNKIDEGIKKVEDKIEQVGEQHRRIELRVNTTSLEHAKVKAELSGLQLEAKEYEGITLIQNKSEEELRKTVSVCEGILTRMGNVNMKALEIYDSVEKEYGELMQKKEKLALEKEDVLVMMNEIETKKKELFGQSFEVVNKNFQNIFSALSTKGDASLVLENPESPFDGGVRIKVKLTGNKFMDIRSLSGGEKTMTALAFIFAIQEHEPASFYIMDEVDAALDKKNSERLGQLIQQYSRRAQYLVISHNDSVIAQGDTLYGISMNEHGMSNATSLKI